MCACVCVLQGIKPRALSILGKCATIELHALPAFISITQIARSHSKTIYSRPGTLHSEHQFPEQLQDFLSHFQRREGGKRGRGGEGRASVPGCCIWAPSQALFLLVEGGVEGRTYLVSPAEVRTRTWNINNKSFQRKAE